MTGHTAPRDKAAKTIKQKTLPTKTKIKPHAHKPGSGSGHTKRWRRRRNRQHKSGAKPRGSKHRKNHFLCNLGLSGSKTKNDIRALPNLTTGTATQTLTSMHLRPCRWISQRRYKLPKAQQHRTQRHQTRHQAWLQHPHCGNPQRRMRDRPISSPSHLRTFALLCVLTTGLVWAYSPLHPALNLDQHMITQPIAQNISPYTPLPPILACIDSEIEVETPRSYTGGGALASSSENTSEGKLTVHSQSATEVPLSRSGTDWLFGVRRASTSNGETTTLLSLEHDTALYAEPVECRQLPQASDRKALDKSRRSRLPVAPPATFRHTTPHRSAVQRRNFTDPVTAFQIPRHATLPQPKAKDLPPANYNMLSYDSKEILVLTLIIATLGSIMQKGKLYTGVTAQWAARGAVICGMLLCLCILTAAVGQDTTTSNPFALMAAGATVAVMHKEWRQEDGIPLDQVAEDDAVNSDGDMERCEDLEYLMSHDESDGDEILWSDDESDEVSYYAPDHEATVTQGNGLLSSTGAWAGDHFGPGRSQGIRLFVDNVRRLPLGDDTHRQSTFWKRLAVRGADFVGIADHGLTFNESKPKGQYASQSSSGKSLKQAEKWGRYGMQWIVATGMPGTRGNTLDTNLEGGTLLAPSAQWRGAAQEHFCDPRGWGRYAGTALKGAKGWKSQLIIVTIYCPSPSSASWARQNEELNQLRPVVRGIEATPRAQCYRDLYNTLTKFRNSKTMRTAYIIMGDFNEPYDENCQINSLFSGITAFAKLMQLQDAMTYKHGGAHNTDKYWTRTEGGRFSTPDHILISKQLISLGALHKVGVWQHNSNFKSDHRMLGVELRCERWLGCSARRLRLRRPKFRTRPPQLYLKDNDKVLQYQQLVLQLFEEREIPNLMLQLNHQVNLRQESDTPFGYDDPALQQSMDNLDLQLFDILITAKNKIAGVNTKEGTKQRTRYKGPCSIEQKKIDKEIRDIDTLLARAKVNKGAAAVRTISFIRKHNAHWLGLCNVTEWRRPQWAAWTTRLQTRRKALRQKYNAEWREQKRLLRQTNRARIQQAFKEKKQRELIARIRGKRPESIDRDCLIVGSGNELACIDTKEQVGDALRDHFAEWFGEGRDSWYQQWENGKVIYTHPLFLNNQEGLEMRQRVVEGLSQDDPDEDLEFQTWLHTKVLRGIPDHIQWVLKLYGRKFSKPAGRRVNQQDYTNRGVMCPITEEKFEKYWAKKAANKAPDFRGLNANLIKALRKTVKWKGPNGQEQQGVLTWKVFDSFRFMLNLVVQTGMIYTTWNDEVMLTVPKVPASLLLNDIRPIGLVPLLRNAFFGIQYSMVKDTWDDLALVSTTQYGAQRRIGTAQFRMMEMTIFEHCYIYMKPITKGNEDKSKAYDKPSITVGYQMGLMRLAVCSKLLTVDAKAGAQGKVHIRFAYGFAPAFQKSGFGSCGFAATQGSEDGPDKYTAFEDPLNSWWEHEDMGVWVEVSEHKSIQLKGGGFVDDKAPMGLLPEVCKWYTHSSLFCLFHGAAPNPPKCAAHVKDYVPNTDRLRRAYNFEPPTMIIAGADEPVKIKLVEADKSLKTLGQLINPALHWKEQLQAIRLLAEETALIMSGPIDRNMAEMYWKTCFERSFIYKALFIETTEEKMYAATLPAWVTYKSKLGLARSTSTKACFAFGIGDLWTQLMVERFMVLLHALNSDKKHVKEVAEAMLFLEQKWEGSATHCLTRKHCPQRGRSGTWVGDIRVFMLDNDITVEGGMGLEMLRANDINLVDTAHNEHSGFVSAGLWCLELWRVSEFFTTSGEIRVQWVTGEWQQAIREDIGYQNPDIKSDAAEACIEHINNEMRRVQEKGSLGGFYRSAIRVGSLAITRSSPMCPLPCDFWLVLVISMPSADSWGDDIVVEILELLELEDLVAYQARGDISDRVWEGGACCQYWSRPTENRDDATFTLSSDEVLPVATKALVNLHREGIELQAWMIDERVEVLECWLRQGGNHTQLGWNHGMISAPTATEEWDFEGRDSLAGFKDFGKAALHWNSYLQRIRTLTNTPIETLTLLIYSDGSFINGSTPKASYGWVIWGFQDFEKAKEIEGGGMVHGNPARLTSTRAEHHGAIAVLIAAYLLGWRGKIQIRLDNSGVTNRMDDFTDKGTKWNDEEIAETPTQWLLLKDPDVYAECMAWVARFENVEWIWYRGHPEKRKHYCEFNKHDWASVACDRIAGEQYNIWGDRPINLNWWDFPHAPKWKIFCGGERLEGEIRKELTTRLYERRALQYIAEYTAKKQIETLTLSNTPLNDLIQGSLSDDIHLKTTAKATRARLCNIKCEEVMTQLQDEWFLPGLIRPMLTKTDSAGERVLGVKILCGILATEASAAHRGVGGEAPPCRLCGQSADGGETNFHVLWRCNCDATVNEARQKLTGEVWEILRGLGLVDCEGVVAAALVAIQKGDSLWNEISGMLDLITNAGATWEQQEVFRTAAAAMDGKAIDWARKGASGSNWVKALTTLGVAPDAAKLVIQKLNTTLRKGSAEVWKAFIKKVHNGDYAQGISHADAAHDMIREIFDEETDMNLIMMGKTIMTWRMARKKNWILRYIELEPEVGRRNAILQANTSAKQIKNLGTQTIGAKWEDAMQAAARKRRRRGGATRQDETMPTDITLMMDPDLRKHQEELGLLTLKGARGAAEAKKAATKRKLRRNNDPPVAPGHATNASPNTSATKNLHTHTLSPISTRAGLQRKEIKLQAHHNPIHTPHHAALELPHDRSPEATSPRADDQEGEEVNRQAWAGASLPIQTPSGLWSNLQTDCQDGAAAPHRNRLGMGGGGAGPRAPPAPPQDEHGAAEGGAGAMARQSQGESWVGKRSPKRSVRGRAKAAGGAAEGLQSALQGDTEGDSSQEDVPRPAQRRKGRRRAITIDSDSDQNSTAGAEERLEGQGRGQHVLGSCWAPGGHEIGGRGHWEGPPHEGLHQTNNPTNWPEHNSETTHSMGASGSNRSHTNPPSLPRPRCSAANPKAGGGGGGHVLHRRGYTEMDNQPCLQGDDRELCVGLHGAHPITNLAPGCDLGETAHRVEGQNTTSNALDLPTMCHILNSTNMQCQQGVHLQRPQAQAQASTPGERQVHEEGAAGRQAGKTCAGRHSLVCSTPQLGMGNGESSGLPGLQAIHEETQAQADSQVAHCGLLCIPGQVQKTHPHMDQHSLDTQRHYPERQVQAAMSWRQEEHQQQVGPQVCFGETEQQGGCRQGQESHEIRSASDASQGANPQLPTLDGKPTVKRPRDIPTRVGHRRLRKCESENSDNEEETELVRRGASTMDCKRRCENTGVS